MRKEDGTSLGFGFVCFQDKEGAMRALAELNGKDGLYVRQALKKAQRMAEVQRVTDRYKSSMLRYNLYFKNLPADASDEELKAHFSQFGEIRSLKIMKKDDETLGFGFVSFATVEAAARARIESKSLKFKGASLYVGQFEPKKVRQAHIEEARDKISLEKHKQLLNSTQPDPGLA